MKPSQLLFPRPYSISDSLPMTSIEAKASRFNKVHRFAHVTSGCDTSWYWTRNSSDFLPNLLRKIRIQGLHTFGLFFTKMLKSQESRPSLAFAAKMSALQSSVKALRPETRAALAGVVGGGLSTLLLHPLDVVKTRQAVFGSNIKKSQLLSGLSKGICANMLVAASSWGVYFAA